MIRNIDIRDLSKIGFGAHLVSDQQESHRQALMHALEKGCNLIDTSANYMRGESEKLIGRVLRESGAPAFVISKTGYHQTEDIDSLLKSVVHNLIHPEFLENRLCLSTERLNGRLDAYLLHNPEFCFTQENPPSKEEFYERIEAAFVFLEEQVERGRIRYYGISSNTFQFSTKEYNTINLKRVLQIAAAISDSHHFKFIEFPFNLYEQDALKLHHEGESILNLAQRNNLITLCNRPLNANTPQGALRLAVYDEDERSMRQTGAQNDEFVFGLVLDCIQKQLDKIGAQAAPMEFSVVQILSKNWTGIGNPEGVNELFNEYFFPFLDELYGGNMPGKHRKIFDLFYEKARLYASLTRIDRTRSFYKELVERKVISETETRPVPVIACEYCLRSGFDHVLVGMRNPAYVDQLQGLFKNQQILQEQEK